MCIVHKNIEHSRKALSARNLRLFDFARRVSGNCLFAAFNACRIRANASKGQLRKRPVSFYCYSQLFLVRKVYPNVELLHKGFIDLRLQVSLPGRHLGLVAWGGEPKNTRTSGKHLFVQDSTWRSPYLKLTNSYMLNAAYTRRNRLY